MDIKRQFSLDHLLGSGESRRRSDTVDERPLDEAIVVYSQPIIQALRQAPGHELRVHDLVRSLTAQKMAVPRFSDFLGVIERLQQLRFLQVVEEEPTGNHLIRLLRQP